MIFSIIAMDSFSSFYKSQIFITGYMFLPLCNKVETR